MKIKGRKWPRAEFSEVWCRKASQASPNRRQSFTLVTVFGFRQEKEREGGGGGRDEGVQRSREHGVMSGAGQNPEERQLKGHHQPRRGAQAGRSATVRLVLLAASEETQS